MTRLDLCFLGHDRRPIRVSPAREIERRAAWGAVKEDIKFLGGILGTIIVAGMLIWLWAAVCG